MKHASTPSEFSGLYVEGEAQEMREWLGPKDLPLHFRPGSTGLYAVTIATAGGEVRLPAGR